LEKAKDLGVHPDFQGGLNLRRAASGRPMNLGVITKDGRYVDTGPATWWDRHAVGRIYNEKLAQLIGGTVREGNHEASWVKASGNVMPKLSDFLPQHETAWLEAMKQYIEDCRAEGLA
jgi:hypothetical protein